MIAPRKLKLIIQIPCYNEEEVLGHTLSTLPRHVPGFGIVEVLIIDDGSRDRTVEVARRGGAHHIISLPHNQGLARAFMAGIEASLRAGADVIVNLDADNQHDASSIPELVAPILDGRAQIVVGERPISTIDEFTVTKKLLQRIGSAVVRLASGTRIPDAPSGFRAIYADAAMRLNVFGQYTYTLETIIQAGRKNIPITSVPVRVNNATRPSRLIRSTPSYLYKSVLSIVRIFVLYKPLRFFFFIGSLFLIPGIALGVRYLYLYARGVGGDHVQSLLLATILVVTSMIIFAAGALSDLIAANRVLLEEIRMRQLRSDMATRRDTPAM